MYRFDHMQHLADCKAAAKERRERSGSGGGIVIRKPSDYEPLDDAEYMVQKALWILDATIRDLIEPPIPF